MCDKAVDPDIRIETITVTPDMAKEKVFAKLSYGNRKVEEFEKRFQNRYEDTIAAQESEIEKLDEGIKSAKQTMCLSAKKSAHEYVEELDRLLGQQKIDELKDLFRELAKKTEEMQTSGEEKIKGIENDMLRKKQLHLRQLKDFKQDYERELDQLSRLSYDLVMAFEETDETCAQKIKKELLPVVATTLRRELDLFLQSIDVGLNFLMQSTSSQRRRVDEKREYIRKQLESLFPEAEKRAKGCIEGPFVLPSALQNGKKTPIQMSGNTFIVTVKGKTYEELMKRMTSLQDECRRQRGSRTEPSKHVHPCQDCGHRCEHEHTCYVMETNGIVHGPKEYKHGCPECDQICSHYHDCPISCNTYEHSERRMDRLAEDCVII